MEGVGEGLSAGVKTAGSSRGFRSYSEGFSKSRGESSLPDGLPALDAPSLPRADAPLLGGICWIGDRSPKGNSWLDLVLTLEEGLLESWSCSRSVKTPRVLLCGDVSGGRVRSGIRRH